MADKTREAFEVWAKKAGWPHYCVNADGSYFCSSSSWEPWQVATQHSAARIAELEAEVQALRKDVEHKDAFAEQIGRDLSKADAECRALRSDAERYRLLTIDHADYDTRIRIDQIAARLSIRGKGATDAMVDTAIEAERAKP